ncbi:flagellar hook-length control protein [Streptacidiphilus sp. 4-A2]|nr:flagellar hook-length control protein [Streptacidiphilus sp. 4-A2]
MKILPRTRLVALAAAAVVAGGLVATGGSVQAATVHPDTATHAGMTWTVATQQSNGEVHVSYDATTNAYQGDTPATAVLPVLCLVANNAPAPADITPGFYAGWAEGWVGLTPAVSGTTLTSEATADALCASDFGTGAKEAEFHAGHYGTGLTSTGGWSFWAYGTIPTGVRFWVAIDDQQANPWD